MKNMNNKDKKITLILSGIILFLLGMILGIVVDRSINNREYLTENSSIHYI